MIDVLLEKTGLGRQKAVETLIVVFVGFLNNLQCAGGELPAWQTIN